MKKHVIFVNVALLVALSVCNAGNVFAARLKDIADVEGVRGNELVGYGMIVGLNGTGDKRGAAFTPQSISNMLERLGVRVDAKNLKLANVASVLVTGTLPPFVRPGSKIDVTLSSLGDASTLQGGVLIMTPLRGSDGKVYAVAQGAVSVGGFAIADGGDSAQKNHPTVAFISRGASVERAVPYDMFASGQIRIVLRQPDFITVTRVENAVNDFFGKQASRAIDSASVVIPLNGQFAEDPIKVISQLETIDVEPDAPARVVVNERTGTIIMGENVRISTVALAHGNISVSIRSETQVSQPEALAGGETAVVENKDIEVSEDQGQLLLVEKSVSLGEVVDGLNNLGATPRDLIAILEAMQRAGALHAELIVM